MVCPRRLRSRARYVGTARCAVWTPQRGVPAMELQTPRLVLRSFRREDVDAMAQLFAYPDFMRFSLGVLPNPNRRSLSSRKLWAGIAPAFHRSLP